MENNYIFFYITEASQYLLGQVFSVQVKIREGGTDWGWGVVVNVVKKASVGTSSSQGGGYIVDTLLHCSTGVSENGAKPKPCPPRPGEKGEMHVVRVQFSFLTYARL